jgi:transcriptional antiterminator NusG
MYFYALQVRTGSEERFVALASRRLNQQEVRLFWPRRRLRIRRRGVWHESEAPIFPSYLFLQAPEVHSALYGEMRRIPGFVRFLPSNEYVAPLDHTDQELLNHFLGFGEIVQKSTAYFDENKRIRIIAGPLSNLEGMIVKVDRRKGRARVRLALYEDSFEVDFGFEALDAAPAPPAG